MAIKCLENASDLQRLSTTVGDIDTKIDAVRQDLDRHVGEVCQELDTLLQHRNQLWIMCGIVSSTRLNITSGGGVVHTNVGHQVTLITLSKGYFCTKFYIRWSCDVMSPSTTTQTTSIHHHHGDGATRLSSGVDLMIPRRPSGRRSCAFIFQGLCSWLYLNSIN